MPRDAPVRGRGLSEVDERLSGLEQISGRITNRFEGLLNLEYVDLADYGLEPVIEAASGGLEPANVVWKPPSTDDRRTETTLDRRRGVVPGDAATKIPVTAANTLTAVRNLVKTKDTSRVRQCTAIMCRALMFGSNEARSVSCSIEAAQALTKLVAGILPVFEYVELYNASRVMSARDVDRAKV